MRSFRWLPCLCLAVKERGEEGPAILPMCIRVSTFKRSINGLSSKPRNYRVAGLKFTTAKTCRANKKIFFWSGTVLPKKNDWNNACNLKSPPGSRAIFVFWSLQSIHPPSWVEFFVRTKVLSFLWRLLMKQEAKWEGKRCAIWFNKPTGYTSFLLKGILLRRKSKLFLSRSFEIYIGG